MSTYTTSLILFLSLLSTGIASAQTYNYYRSPVSCPALTSDLSVGSRGSQVLALQTFLVAQNYPGGGTWMITGHYGQATKVAVRNFQVMHGLPQTGVVDRATRSLICSLFAPAGDSYYNYGTNYSYDYTYQTTYNTSNCGAYPYFYSCYTNNTSAPILTSLSPTYGVSGTSVTVYGSNFDRVNNVVYFGGTTIRNISSYNGVAITFAVPVNAWGANTVSIGNAYGVSNALTFQAGANPTGCGTYPYGGYGTYCPPPANGQISIGYLNPASGAIGANVTVYGFGFSADGNSVRFGNGIIANLHSGDGRTLSFTIPSTISGYGYQPIGLGLYDVSVKNAAGQTSNTVPFTITSLGGSTNNLI